MEDDQRAVLALAQADPDVAVHGEDVAGLEVFGLESAVTLVGSVLISLLNKNAAVRILLYFTIVDGAPALFFSEILSLAGGGHDIALVAIGHRAALGVHQVIDRPAHIAGAVGAAIVVLIVPAPVVGVSGVIVIPIGVICIMALEEIQPALGQADGHGLVGRISILPVPGAAVDIQRGAYGLHGGGQEVLQGQLAGHAADRGGVVLGNEHPEQLGHMVIRVHHDADGIIYLQLIERDFRNSGSAGLSVDVIKFGVIIDGEGFIVNINLFAGSFDVGQDTGHVALLQLDRGDFRSIQGDVIDITLHQLVLNGVVFVLGDGVDFFLAVDIETVLEGVFVIAVRIGKVLNSQVDNILTICLPGGGICL